MLYTTVVEESLVESSSIVSRDSGEVAVILRRLLLNLGYVVRLGDGKSFHKATEVRNIVCLEINTDVSNTAGFDAAMSLADA